MRCGPTSRKPCTSRIGQWQTWRIIINWTCAPRHSSWPSAGWAGRRSFKESERGPGAISDGQKGAVQVLFNIARTMAVRLRAADAHIGELSHGSSQGTVVSHDLDRLRNIFFTEWV